MKEIQMTDKCDRCGKRAFTTTMSQFNTQCICFECEVKEHDHPKYSEALEAERKAIENGNYNFEGIGLPADLSNT